MRDGHDWEVDAPRYVDLWPFDEEWDKRPKAAENSPRARVRSLVKAGALCAAEVDRIIRRFPDAVAR